MAWVCVHMQREFWAMSKKAISQEDPDLPKTYFGAIDTSLFLTYAIAQFFTGAIGDTFTKRKVLAISFTIQAGLFGIIALAAFKGWDHQMLFVFLFGGIGLIQSVDFPCFISTIGAWTNERTRGTVTGVWATCGNVGNILGI